MRVRAAGHHGAGGGQQRAPLGVLKRRVRAGGAVMMVLRAHRVARTAVLFDGGVLSDAMWTRCGRQRLRRACWLQTLSSEARRGFVGATRSGFGRPPSAPRSAFPSSCGCSAAAQPDRGAEGLRRPMCSRTQKCGFGEASAAGGRWDHAPKSRPLRCRRTCRPRRGVAQRVAPWRAGWRTVSL